MKKISLYTAILAMAMTLGSCSKEWLEVTPKGQDLEVNYYQNQDQAWKALVAVYDVVGWTSGDYIAKVNTLDCLADDHFTGGGGASDMDKWQVLQNFSHTAAKGPAGDLWKKGFSGIYRANILLQKLPNIPMDENLKKRYTAEAKALRAYFYFDLVRLFRNVPLFTEPVTPNEMYNVLQAKPEDVYAQIETDLTEALSDIPPTVPVSSEGGRFTQGMVHALLGKVYLWQEKFGPAATEFADVNGTPGGTSKYGYKLLAKFADLFDTPNKFNSESIFEIGYTSTSNGDWGCVACTEGNVMNIITGPRDYVAKTANAPDYVSGWSFIVITPELYNAMKTDPRFKATIADVDSLVAAGAATYTAGYNNTGYFLEKYMGRRKYESTGGGAKPLNFPQNLYEIRLADTYLLEAEALLKSNGDLTRAAALFNAVRARVGLPATTLTMDNLMKERRFEFVGEGHRFLDLVRWNKAVEVLGPRGFKPNKNEIFPIPLSELENTKLVQNPGY